MTLETLALGLVAVYLMWRLYKAILKDTQKQPEKIRLISKETGEIVEMQIIQPDNAKKNTEWNKAAFIDSAKRAFQQTLHSFAVGNLKDLKNVLSPTVYKLFEEDILNRQNSKNKMDFSLICFDSVDIISKSPKNDTVTVQFITEQINLLKNEQGEVIEGDPMNIAIMQDTWVFQKMAKDNWIITATHSQAHHA